MTVLWEQGDETMYPREFEYYGFCPVRFIDQGICMLNRYMERGIFMIVFSLQYC